MRLTRSVWLVPFHVACNQRCSGLRVSWVDLSRLWVCSQPARPNALASRRHDAQGRKSGYHDAVREPQERDDEKEHRAAEYRPGPMQERFQGGKALVQAGGSLARGGSGWPPGVRCAALRVESTSGVSCRAGPLSGFVQINSGAGAACPGVVRLLACPNTDCFPSAFCHHTVIPSAASSRWGVPVSVFTLAGLRSAVIVSVRFFVATFASSLLITANSAMMHCAVPASLTVPRGSRLGPVRCSSWLSDARGGGRVDGLLRRCCTASCAVRGFRDFNAFMISVSPGEHGLGAVRRVNQRLKRRRCLARLIQSVPRFPPVARWRSRQNSKWWLRRRLGRLPRPRLPTPRQSNRLVVCCHFRSSVRVFQVLSQTAR